MKIKPELSIVIVSWNTRDVTRDCIDSIYEHRPKVPFEVILVDNASTDDTVEFFRREYGQVRVIANEENLLFSEGNNVGAREAEGRYLCLLNSDTKITAGALDSMIEFLDNNLDYATVAPKLLNFDGSTQPSCKRIEGPGIALIKSVGFDRFPPGKWLRNRNMMTSFDHESSIDANQLMGAVLLFRTEEYLKQWVLDPDMSLFFNMEDLFRRMRKSSYKARYLTEAEIFHIQGKSTGMNRATKVLMHRNRLSYYRKHFGAFGEKYASFLVYLRTVKKYLRLKISRKPKKQKEKELKELNLYLGEIFAKR